MSSIISIITVVTAGAVLVVGIFLAVDVVPGRPLNLGAILWTAVSLVTVGIISVVGINWVDKRSSKPDKTRRSRPSSRQHIAKEFGNLLRNEMEQQRLPLQQIALSAGIDESRVRLLTSGEEIPSAVEAINLFDAFNIPPEQRMEFLPTIYDFELQAKKQH